jgi:hypothetical protein
MPAALQADDGSAVIDFVLTAIPVFASLQFVLGLLGFYGTAFFDARSAIFESGQLAVADRDNRESLGYSGACKGGFALALMPKTCWHTKLEPTFVNATLS